MRKRKLRRIHIIGAALVVLFLGILMLLRFTTGFFSPSEINAVDEEVWEYKEGVIAGADAFTVEGSKARCWFMIHGYSSTPDDVRALAERVNDAFNETVVAPRLVGHGEVPKNMLNLTFTEWYAQMETEYLNLAEQCSEVSVVGYSMGGAITLKLAETYDLHSVYVISPYLILRYKFWHIFSLETYLTLFADRLVYLKLPEPGQINDPAGNEEYIAYRSFPLPPLKHSLDDIATVRAHLGSITEPILVLQSENDIVVDIESSHLIIDSVASTSKELKQFTRSNHVLLFDYEREEAISAIIAFERALRE